MFLGGVAKFNPYLVKIENKTENKNFISFLDIKINRDNKKFTTSVYRKPTFSGFLPFLEASPRNHTGHSNFAQILNFLFRKLSS